MNYSPCFDTFETGGKIIIIMIIMNTTIHLKLNYFTPTTSTVVGMGVGGSGS
jgi:hypothetical protein